MEARIRIAANAIIIRDGLALLVQFDDETGPHYNFPGGGVMPGESLAEGLRREVLEETCLQVEVGRLLLIVESVASRNRNLKTGVGRNELRCFVACTPLDGASDPRLPDTPDGNQVDVCWLPLASLPDIAVLPQVARELITALDAAAGPPHVIANPHR